MEADHVSVKADCECIVGAHSRQPTTAHKKGLVGQPPTIAPNLAQPLERVGNKLSKFCLSCQVWPAAPPTSSDLPLDCGGGNRLPAAGGIRKECLAPVAMECRGKLMGSPGTGERTEVGRGAGAAGKSISRITAGLFGGFRRNGTVNKIPEQRAVVIQSDPRSGGVRHGVDLMGRKMK
jgi:hypothetical protein